MPRTKISAARYNNLFIKRYPKLFNEYKRLVLRFLKQKKRWMIGDIGSGPGTLAWLLKNAKKNIRLYCVDINRRYIEYAKRFSTAYLNISGRVADARKLPKDFYGFDMVVSNMALHEILDPRKQSSEMQKLANSLHRRIKTKGILIVGESFYPPQISDSEILRHIKKQRKQIGHADIKKRFPPPRLIISSFEKIGFRLVTVKKFFPYPKIKREYSLYVFQKR